MCGKKIASKNGRKSIKNRWGVMDTMAGRRVRLGVVLERLGVDRLAIGWRSFGGFFWVGLVSKGGLLPFIVLIGS